MGICEPAPGRDDEATERGRPDRGRIVVPLLSPPLTEQVDRYFSQHKIGGVRFLNDHRATCPA